MKLNKPTLIIRVALFVLTSSLFFSGFASQDAKPAAPPPVAPAAQRIPVPVKLADEYRQALDTEARALQLAMQTVEYKDFQTAQQQRLKTEMMLFGELGCKPSLARVPRDEQGRILVGKDGRIEAIECLPAGGAKP